MDNNNESRKTIIYLTELCHDGFGLSLRTFPLGLGVLGSYLKSKYPDDIELDLFRTYGDLMDAVTRKKPDIVGFGYFSWNDYLSLVTAREIRKQCSDALIVFGGANISPYGQEKTSGFPIVSEGGKECVVFAPTNQDMDSYKWPVYNDYELLVNYPNIDVIIHGDAELPFADIVGLYLKTPDRHAVKSAALAGCSALVGEKIIRGPAPEILYDLDQIPSPYTSGMFKNFMDKYRLLPQIETLRGCPYKCTFCTVGLNEGKLRKHSLEYSKQEIMYLKDNYPHTVLRIADPNWGMVKKDVELADFIHDIYEKEGYPSTLRVYYSAGGPLNNIKKMAIKMKDLLPLNMSFQSLNEDTLKIIKRGNMSMSKIRDMVSFARENGIASSTELISGLPKESLQSFKECFLTAVKLRLDSVYMGATYLIKGSELYTPAAREEHKFKTNFSLIEKDVTYVEGRWVFECDELIVEHTHMSRDDFFELYRFKLWAMLAYAAAYLKEILMHCLNYGVSPLDIYDELMANKGEYHFNKSILNGYIENIRPLFFETPQELEVKLVEHIEKHGNVDAFYYIRFTQLTMAKVLGQESKDKFVNEVVKAARRVYEIKTSDGSGKEKHEAFYSIIDELKGIQSSCIISPLEKQERIVRLPCNFDLKTWADDNYDYPLAQYKLSQPKNFALTVRNIQEHHNFLKEVEDFTSDAEKYEFYYNVMVSSNLRRYIDYAENADEHRFLPGAVHPMENREVRVFSE
jgi:radical SAM superfamily enzyme YgiQ (UPF0313 family)